MNKLTLFNVDPHQSFGECLQVPAQELLSAKPKKTYGSTRVTANPNLPDILGIAEPTWKEVPAFQ